MFHKERRAVAGLLDLMVVGMRFVQASSWAESAAVLHESPELLTEAGDAAMSALMERCHSEGEQVLLAVVEQHRQVLRDCREHGVAATLAALEAASVPKTMPDEALTRIAAETLFAQSLADLRALIDQHEELVSPAGIATMQTLLAVARENAAAADVARTEDRLQLIERCMAVGVAAAFDEYEARLAEDATREAGRVDELAARFRAASTALSRSAESDTLSDWDACVGLFDELVVALETRSGHVPTLVLLRAGLASMLRYRLSRDGADLDHAERRWAEAAPRHDIPDEDAEALLGGLADIHIERHRREGRERDRDDAIAALQRLLVSGLAPTSPRQAELAGLLFARHLQAADAEAGQRATELARAVVDGVASRPEEEQLALLRLPAALRTIIAGGTDDEVAEDIAHGDHKPPDDVAQLMPVLFGARDWEHAAGLVDANPRLLDADTRRYVRGYATLTELAGDDTTAVRTRCWYDFLLASLEGGAAAAAARFSVEDEQMRPLLADVPEAKTTFDLIAWCQMHPDLSARRALVELYRQADVLHEAGEPERRDAVERRRMLLQSWRKGDRLIPPPRNDAVRSAAVHINSCLNSWAESGDPAALAEAIEVGERVRTESEFAEADAASRSHLVGQLALVYVHRDDTRMEEDDLGRAVALLEEAVELAPIGSEAHSTALLNLGTSLGRAGAALAEPGKLRRSQEVLAQLAEEMDAADPDRPLALWNLANAIDELASLDPQRQDEAISMGEHALSITPTRSEYIPGRIDGLGVMLRHRTQRFRHASAAAASADLRRAVTLQRRAAALLSDGSLGQAKMLVHQANALLDLYQVAADEDSFGQSVAVYEQAFHCAAATPSIKADALAGRGYAFLLRHRRRRTPEDLRAGREMIEESLAIDPRADEGNRLRRVATLAAVMPAGGDPSLLDGAITVLQDAIGSALPDDPSRPTALLELAGLLFIRYRVHGSSADADAAAELLDAIGPGDAMRASVLDMRGHLCLERYRHEHDRGDLEAAIEHLSEASHALVGARRLVVAFGLAQALAERYDLTHDDGDRVRASLEFRSVVRDAGHTLPGLAMAAALHWSAWTLNREAWPEAEAAAAGGMEAMQQLVRGQLRRDAKQDWIRNAQDLSVRAAVARHHRGDAPGAVVALETGRALLLDESLDRTRLDLDSLARDGHEEMARRYDAAAQRWGDLVADTDPMSPAGDTADAAEHARDDLDTAIDAIRGIGGRYASFASAPTIEDIVTASVRDTIVYLSAAPPGGLAFIVRADGTTAAIELPELTTVKLADVVGAWSAAYEKRHDDRASWWRCVEHVTQWLWRVAMSAVDAAAPGNEPLALVACGLLSALPLHAATDQHGQAVIDRRSVRYVPNTRAFARAQDRAASPERGSGLLAIQDPGSIGLSPLPYAAAEVDAACARLVVGPVTRLPAPTEPANSALVLDTARSQRVLHFCCHGAADPQDPVRSGLHLADDERITAADVMSQHIASRLVVLSACESGIVGRDLPDEVIGLPTAFLEAGAAGVVGSLWSVTEPVTVAVLDEFYRLWNSGDGTDPAAALAAAQSWARHATNEELHERFPGIGRFDPAAVPDAALRLWRAATPLSEPADWAALTYVGA
jgi:CHAT domain-containing protein